jgi:NAD(P)H-hydrate epimerase
MNGRQVLITANASQALDGEAVSQWSFNHFALVEAAGRAAATVLLENFPRFGAGRVVVLAGGGNNAADALVLIRALILFEKLRAQDALILITGIPGPDENDPRSAVFFSLQKMGVPATLISVALDDGQSLEGLLENAALIIDGLTGTGLQGPLREDLLVRRVNGLKKRPPLVSIDVPSGLFDEWTPAMPLLEADAVLAIEPLKLCLYKPAARPFCGRILPVGGIFPAELMAQYGSAELVDWDGAQGRFPPAPRDSYKYSRGLVEIRAGAPGSTGAARIAARGAQAAGAGLIRLVVDPAIQPVLAATASGVMVDSNTVEARFTPDALLLGPGWGRGPEQQRVLAEALAREAKGTPLVLDADAIFLAKDAVFHGNVLLTPHPGELAVYSGISREELLANPVPHLLALAKEKNAVLLFKSHVLFVASPDGRMGVVDGMQPVLAAGGSGDLLAGLCVAIAARWRGIAVRAGVDLYDCALAGASLLIRAAGTIHRFADPLEFADAAAELAGRAWLPQGEH